MVIFTILRPVFGQQAHLSEPQVNVLLSGMQPNSHWQLFLWFVSFDSTLQTLSPLRLSFGQTHSLFHTNRLVSISFYVSCGGGMCSHSTVRGRSSFYLFALSWMFFVDCCSPPPLCVYEDFVVVYTWQTLLEALIIVVVCVCSCGTVKFSSV